MLGIYRAHVKDKIVLEDLANLMGYSLYHFCRIFYAYQGMTPMEYVLERKLQAAIVDLQQGRKVIDVACDYCFDTASGFSKAFRKRYGQSPKELIRNIELKQYQTYNSCPPIKIDMREIEPIEISGYCKTFDYDSSSFEESMIAYWEYFEEENIEDKLYASLNPRKHGEFAITIRNGEDTTEHRYLLGVLGKNTDSKIPWRNYKIAGGQYAVFTTVPVDTTKNESNFSTVIRDTWSYIFTNWFQTVNVQYDTTREAFEYYDERCHYNKDSVMEIYIPIRT